VYGREANFQHDCRKIQGQASRQVIFKYFFFYTKHKVQEVHIPHGMSRILTYYRYSRTPVLPRTWNSKYFRGYHKHFLFLFLPSAGNRKEKFQKFQKYEILWSFRVRGKKIGELSIGHRTKTNPPNPPKKPHVPGDQGVNRPPISIVKPLRQSWVLAFGHHIASTVLCYLHCRIWPRHTRTRWNVFFVS
jgi:hypothetical protein